VFGFSFGELLVISLVTLVAVGPQKLPGVLKTIGQWARKLRKMTLDVRQQTGIDEMLRAEGIQLSELRSLMRDYHPASIAASLSAAATAPPRPAPAPAQVQVEAAVPVAVSATVSTAARYEDPYVGLEPDPTREYPPEGADACGALPDDLLEPPKSPEVGAAPGAPEPTPDVQVETANALPPSEPPAPAAETANPPVAAAPMPAASQDAPAPAPSRTPSMPPPPPSRASTPRVSSAPPPPPRRSPPPPPPRPEPVSATTEAPSSGSLPSSPGSANGNG
jgi:sec-independent protein translocase protein TatB